MASLNEYLRQTQKFLHDPRQVELNPRDLIQYINRARRETAMRACCIRRLTPISGQVISASVTSHGAGYTSGATVSISAPDLPPGNGPKPGGDQATATATVNSGTLSAVNISYGGYGYFSPIASVTAAHGSGASVSLQLSPINTLNPQQEVYNFSDVDLSIFPGCDSVYTILSLSILYSNYRYSLPVYAFSTYQSLIRQYAQGYTYVPTYAAQYGQGAAGSFYVYPLPAQTYPFELDCFCLPSDLNVDLDYEAIPAPWTDAVPFMAAKYAYAELQNFNASKYYEDQFDKYLQRYSIYARPGRATNPYGRY